MSTISESDESAVMPPPPIPYTLRIGVTGHRTLPDPGVTAVSVRAALVELRQILERVSEDPHHPPGAGETPLTRWEGRCARRLKQLLTLAEILPAETPSPRRTELRWRVISPLARGADRIVARVAQEHFGAKLDVILPFSKTEYERDFATADDLAEFRTLLAGAARRREPDPELVAISPELRAAGYQRVGEQVVAACEILLAVWDGRPARGPGGTAEIIQYALSVNCPVVWVHAHDPTRPACLLIGLVGEGDKAFAKMETRPLAEIMDEFCRPFAQLAEYNRDRAYNPAEFQQIYRRNQHRLERARDQAGLASGMIQPRIEILLAHYAWSDQLAIHYQQLHLRAGTGIYRLSALAVGVAVAQQLFFPEHTGWIALEIASLLCAVGWFRVGACENWHRKWLNYRHLAERLRTRLFTSLVPPKPNKDSPNPVPSLEFYPGPGRWVEAAFGELEAELPPPPDLTANFAAIKGFVRHGWILDQIDFHAGSSDRKAHLAHSAHQRIAFMLIVTLIAGGLHWLEAVELPLGVLVIAAVAIILPAIASAEHAIGGLHDYERIATRSAGMAGLLRRIDRAMAEAATEADLQDVIERAERIVSTENHEWCVSLSFHPPGPPI